MLCTLIGAIILSINIQVGLNMHLYDDIGDAADASSSVRGSTSSLWSYLFLCLFGRLVYICIIIKIYYHKYIILYNYYYRSFLLIPQHFVLAVMFRKGRCRNHVWNIRNFLIPCWEPKQLWRKTAWATSHKIQRCVQEFQDVTEIDC